MKTTLKYELTLAFVESLEIIITMNLYPAKNLKYHLYVDISLTKCRYVVNAFIKSQDLAFSACNTKFCKCFCSKCGFSCHFIVAPSKDRNNNQLSNLFGL